MNLSDRLSDDFEIDAENETVSISKHGIETVLSWARLKTQVWELEGAPAEDIDMDTRVALLVPLLIRPWQAYFQAVDNEHGES